MKKFLFLISAIVTSFVIQDTYAGTYVSGSFSTMMGSSLSWSGNASKDPKYYTIDCPGNATFCNGNNLKWTDKDKQTVDTKLNKKSMFSGAFGYFDSRKPYRFEVEYANITNELKEATYKIVYGANLANMAYDFKGDTLTIKTLMGNAYYSIKVDSFNPYVGIGVGYINGKMSFIHPDQSINIKPGLAFQFMAGAEVPVQKGLYIGAELRFLDFGSLSVTDSYLKQTDKLKKGSSNGILLKVRYELSQDKNKKSRCKSGKCKTRRKKVAHKYSRDDYYY